MPACAKVTSSHGAPGGQRDGGAVGLHDRCRPEAASYRPAWLYGVNTTDSFHHPLSGGGGDPIALDNAGLASRAAVPKARPVASRTTTMIAPAAMITGPVGLPFADVGLGVP